MKTRFVLAIVLFLSSASTLLSPNSANNVSANEGLTTQARQASSLETSADWLTEIQTDIQQSEYAVTWQDKTYLADVPAAYQAPNRAHNLRTYFTESGIRLIPRQTQDIPEWEWGLSLKRYGYTGALINVSAATLEATDVRIEYQRNALTEWYVNDERGLEQGFTLEHAPANPTSASALMLELTLSGDLEPQLADDGTAIDFFTRGGVQVLRYDGLVAYDANGRALPAHLSLTGDTLQLIVEAADAVYPVTIDPLATTPNWTAESNQAGAGFGVMTSPAGDINADGYSDVIVGAMYFDNGQTDEGRAYVYYGSASGLSASPNWTTESNQADARYGYGAGTAGDVNGDGFSDVLVGAVTYDNGQNNEGRVYLFYGSATGLSPTPNWMDEGDLDNANMGSAVNTAGDVNGDGYSDVLVGEWYYYDGQSDGGQVAFYYGSASGLNSSPDWMATSDQTTSHLGHAVSTAGDVNGDGYADIILGAYGYNAPNGGLGQAYVYHGSASGLGPNGTPSNADWVLSGDSGAWVGIAVSTAGDVNSDGYADVLIGAAGYNAGLGFGQGRAYVYLGSVTGLNSTAIWTGQGDQSYNWYGGTANSAGDINGDGYADIIIGAEVYTYDQFQEGRAFVYFGNSDGVSATPAWVTEGNQANSLYGKGANTAGDVNGDGYADVIVGAMNFDNGQTDEGRAFVYHGSPAGLSTTANWTQEGNQTGAGFGVAAGAAGDINGDGYADVIIGAPNYDNGQIDEGQAFVYQGSAFGLSTSPVWLAECDQAGASCGTAAETAGDVNGDGYDDILVGASAYDNGQIDEGAVFVWFGSSTGLGAHGTPGNAAWMMESNQAGANMGVYAAGTAGDVNGDGYSDVLAGAHLYDDGETNEGLVSVFHGSPTGPSTSPDWTEEGNRVEAWFGDEANSAGDVNGDGYSDVIVGAAGNGSPSPITGYTYIYFGSASGLSETANWTNTNDQPQSKFGGSVNTAGDVNGDGYADVVVGAQWYDGGAGFAQGRAYVYYGGLTGPDLIPDSTFQTCPQSYCDFGSVVNTAGDVNGDGYADLIIGAWLYDNEQADEGGAFVYYGSGSGLSSTPNWTIESNQSNARLGNAVGTAGDVNGDGYADVIAGALWFDGGQTDEGAAYVYYGNSHDASGSATITFASEATWQVYDADPAMGSANLLGNAQKVCLNAAYPSPCPPEAMVYGRTGEGWLANLASIPGANWIWAPGITGATSPAEYQQFFFSKSFTLAGTPSSGTIYVGADDLVEVRLNGQILGSYGSLTDFTQAHNAQSALTTFNLTPYLIPGNNILTIRAQNGSPTLGGCTSPCTYMQNTAGVVFGGLLSTVSNTSSVSLNPRQRQASDSTPVAHLGASDANAFRLAALGRTPFGRGKVKLEWEVKPLGTLFTGIGTQQSVTWMDTGTAGTELNELVSNLASNTVYHWRLRLLYHPVTTPYQQHSRWLTNPWNGWNETRLRTSVPASVAGHAIVFARPQPGVAGDADVWIMNWDGSNETQLTTDTGEDRMPALSPDGSKVAYQSVRGGQQTLWVMNSDGTNPVQLPIAGNTQRLDWSPDGTRLAITNDSVDWWEIWVINADGTTPQRLTTHTAAAGEPNWSPNGQKLVYGVNPAAGDKDLYTINADGTGQTLLLSTSSGFSHAMAAWSPNGAQIAAIRWPAGSTSGPYDLWLMNADGTNGNTLIQNIDQAHLNRLSWSKDGNWIVFAKNGQIWRVRKDGTGLTQINTSGWEPHTNTVTFGALACSPLSYESDIALVLDRSSSMNQDDKIGAAKEALSTFITDTNAPPDQLALVSFAVTATLDQPLTSDKSALLAAVQAITTTSGTRIDLGLYEARLELGGVRHIPSHRKIMILLSDGHQSGGNNQLVIDEANAAKADGAIIYTIGLGADADQDLLIAVATSPQHYYFAPTGDDLAEIYSLISTALACPNLGGQVFVDTNLDGQYASGIDQPLAGVTVNLTGPVISQTISTNQANGNYVFPGLLTGTYTVSVEIPVGYQLTTPLSYVINLNLNDELNNDFGFIPPATPTPTHTPTPTQTHTPTPTPTACSASPLTNDLIAYWKLDETSGTRLDSTGRGNNLADNNTVIYNAGKIGNAAQFSAASQEYLSHLDNADLSMGDVDFTMAGWIYLDVPKTNGIALGKGNADGFSVLEYGGLTYDGTTDRFGGGISNGSGQTNLQANAFGSPVAGQWYFMVYWHDSVNNQLGVSINGVENTLPYANGGWDTPFEFRLGGDTSGGRYWNGRVDEVGMWKRVLSLAERTTLYNNGSGLTYPFGSGDPCPTPTHTATPTQTHTPSPTPTACSPTPSPLLTGLVAYWKLDETSGTRIDSTGRGNNLADNNTVTYSAGKIGNAAQFVATQQEYLNHSDNVDLSMGSVDFTLVTWVRLDSKASPSRNFLTKWNTATNQREYSLYHNYAADRFRFAISSNGNLYTEVQADAAGSPALNTWYLLMAWHDSVNNTLNLQVNDGAVASVPYTSGGWDDMVPFMMGASDYGTVGLMNGSIDEAGVWKRVLTSSERAMLYNNGAGTTYPFDSGTGACPTPTITPTPTPTGSLPPTFTPTPTRTITATPSPSPVPACFTGPWVYRNDFQGTVGSEWSSTTTTYTPSGRRFLGQFNNQSVSLILTQLPAHTQLKVCLDLYVIRSWDGNTVSDPTRGATGPDRWSLGVLGQPTALDTTFTNWADYQQAYPGNYPASYPAHTGAREIGTLGYTYNSQSMDSVYRVLVTINHTDTFAVLNFAANGLQDLADESWGIDNIEVITTDGIPLGPYGVYLPFVNR